MLIDSSRVSFIIGNSIFLIMEKVIYKGRNKFYGISLRDIIVRRSTKESGDLFNQASKFVFTRIYKIDNVIVRYSETKYGCLTFGLFDSIKVTLIGEEDNVSSIEKLINEEMNKIGRAHV